MFKLQEILGCAKFFSNCHYAKKINVKKNCLSIFECSTFYTTTLDKCLIKVLSEVISFILKSKDRQHIGISKKPIYWTFKGFGRRYLTKQTLVNAISFLKNKCFITLLVTWFFNKIFAYQLVMTQHHSWPTSSFISLNLSI